MTPRSQLVLPKPVRLMISCLLGLTLLIVLLVLLQAGKYASRPAVAAPKEIVNTVADRSTNSQRSLHLATTITVTSPADSGPGTLRQALLDAQSGDTITFDPVVFPPASPVTIALTSELPSLSQGNLTIDGSEAGVILDGNNISNPDADGLIVGSAGNVIQGLQVLNFPRIGIHLVSGANNNTIGGDATVGSSPSGQSNVISGNGHAGIYIGTGHHNVIVGNRIGTDASGTAALGNNAGVLLREGAQNNQIGGTTVGERNVIAANSTTGVQIMDTDTAYNAVTGNFIGTDVNGTAALPNAGYGVAISEGASYNVIGGVNASPGGACTGECNLISSNDGDGVHISSDDTLYDTITQNSIHSNGDEGIELRAGGNNELPPPVITHLTGGDTITGTACANCTVEIFSDDAEEGRIYEGTTTADGSGNFTVSKPGGFTGPNVTATATDAAGNTSEFSTMVAQRQAENVELVSQIGGTVETVAISGTLAYIGAGPRLIILDVSDPANAAIVGRTEVLPGRVMDIVLAQDYIYAANADGGLRIMDVSNPASPNEVGSYDTPGFAWSVAVAGNYAYVADREALRIIDVPDPASLSQIGSYEELEDARDVTVVGSNAYVAGGYEGLRIIDVSDPTSPSEIGSYRTSGDPPPSSVGDVVVAGNHAYLSEWPMGDPSREGLLIVDVSDPTAPTEAGFYSTGGGVLGIVIRDSLAYIASPGVGLDIIDVSDPTEPTRFGDYFHLPGIAESVAVAGDYAYVGLWDSGLAIVDISNPVSPTGAGSYHDAPGESHDVAVAGNYAYVAEAPMFGIVDISDPAAPTYTGFYDTVGWAEGVAVVGDYAYVAVRLKGLRVMDVSDPALPSEVGFYDTPGSAYGVAIANNHAFVADRDSGLRVINIADPANPSEVGFYDTPGSAYGVAIADNHAFVADGDSGLRVINIADPANPSEVGFYDTPGSAYGVAIANNHAFVADGDSGLRVINIADPANPSEVGFYDTPGSAYGVAIANNHAFVADRDSGLRVINVADPANPSEVGFYDTPGSAYGVAVVGNYVYVADEDGGLIILRFTGVPACYDFVPNGQVDAADIQAVAARWRDPGQYDARYDVAPDPPDGVINVLDIMRVAAAWGDTCP